MGVDPDRVDVVGYPVRQSFLRGPGRDEARVAAGLRDEFTCLLLIGGEGVGLDAQPIVAALREQPFPVQVVVIAGRNEALRSELAERWSSDPLVRVEGFVADIAGLLRAADVVVGKTGPASTFETLAVGRPILAPRRSGTSENRILAFLEARALGAHVPTLASLLERIRGYHERPDTLAEIERRCRAFDFPGMTERVGRYLAAHARDGVPDPSLQGPGIE
jgi:UDP-N-acetylglucosamine:LPS N-acetylglucosamine transferase